MEAGKEQFSRTSNIKDSGKGDDFVLLIKRTEKLTAAVYKITELMPDSEPLKWGLRTCAVDIITQLASSLEGTTLERETVLGGSLVKIDQLYSLFEVSLMGGVISRMNATLVADEYKNVRDVIEVNLKNRSISTLLEGIPSSLHLVSEGEALRETQKKDDEHKRQARYLGIKDRKTRRVSGKPLTRDVLRDERRKTILNFVSEHGESSIKDIFKIPEFFQHYSEKTIQRELVNMVNDGAIKKRGERRWSKYYL